MLFIVVPRVQLLDLLGDLFFPPLLGAFLFRLQERVHHFIFVQLFVEWQREELLVFPLYRVFLEFLLLGGEQFKVFQHKFFTRFVDQCRCSDTSGPDYHDSRGRDNNSVWSLLLEVVFYESVFDFLVVCRKSVTFLVYLNFCEWVAPH